MLNPTVVTNNYNSAAFRLASQSIVECRFPQSTDISEIIAVSPQLSCVLSEAAAGRANYAGRLVLSIVCADEEGKLCRMQKGAEFSHSADDERLTSSHTLTTRLACDKISVRREGSSFVVAAIVSADICAYIRGERSYVTGAEGAFLNLRRTSFCSVINFSGESEVEDKFDADSVADILVPSAKAVVQSVVCGTGEAEINGEIYLSLFAMRGQSPATLERVIPFRSVVACDDCSLGRQAIAFAEISDLNVAATVNEERGKCEVEFTCTLAFSGNIYDVTEDDAAVDAFSCDNELELAFSDEEYEECGEIKVYTQRVSGLAATSGKLGYDCRFAAVALPEAECAQASSPSAVEGVVRATLVYEQNGEMRSTVFELPFAERLAGMADDGQKVRLDCAVSGISVRLRAEGEVEAEAVLKICAVGTRERKIRYISSIVEGREKPVPLGALSVCFPAAGDGLWEAAKKLSQSPDEVAALNPSLSYPLTGKERIIVYRARQATK